MATRKSKGESEAPTGETVEAAGEAPIKATPDKTAQRAVLDSIQSPQLYGMTIEWDYGRVKVAFRKEVYATPLSMIQQDHLYDALTQQLEHEHEEWAREWLPRLARHGEPIR